MSERRRGEHRQPAEDVQNAENALGGEETIRHHAEEKGRYHGGDGAHRVSPVDDVCQADGRHVIANGDVPRSPNEELEEHHGREAAVQTAHRSSLRIAGLSLSPTV